jgi:flagellum-specific peptidoglycan hydrolase FlgJ
MSKNLIDTPAEIAALPKTGDAFIDQYADEAINSQILTGVPASVTLAQALIESGRGKSGLTKRGLNFFGIKGTGPAGSVIMRTREWSKQRGNYYINAPFRAYRNAMESFIDHGNLFFRVKVYRNALKYLNDGKRFAAEIHKAGYATDPNYTKVLHQVIDRYGLLRFDEIARKAQLEPPA